MKSRNYIIRALLLGIIVGAGACDSYLEENPDNRVELNTTKKAAQLLTNAYSNAGYTFTEWMSDNVSFTTGTFILPEHDESYKWEVVTTDDQDTPTNFWTSTYNSIAHSNEVLAIIDDLPGDRDEKRAVEAEALLTRAYGHFMLVNLFAKHYDPATAASDPGIPYVLEPETEFIKQYDRNTVEEVYDYIEDDLRRGLNLVDDSFYANSGKYHFTRNAALAFASRFYLFKQDWASCVDYSTQMLGESPEVFIKDIQGILDETANPDDFIRNVTAPNDPSNILMARQVTNFPVNVGYWPLPSHMNNIMVPNVWNEDDVRSSNYYPTYLRGSGWGLAKFEFLFERTSLTSNVGLYYTIAPLFRGEEVLLNRAEAYARLNTNTAAAVADLQTLANYRYTGPPTVTAQAIRNGYGAPTTLDGLMLYIIDERRKEFMHEGLRWFDIKRFAIPVTHLDAGGAPMVLQPNDPRKVLQIPQAAIDLGGLEPNPR